jgi:hypothetical protein
MAYLLGQGGVHQRAGRSPELIPVYGLGRQTVADQTEPGRSIDTARFHAPPFIEGQLTQQKQVLRFKGASRSDR